MTLFIKEISLRSKNLFKVELTKELLKTHTVHAHECV